MDNQRLIKLIKWTIESLWVVAAILVLFVTMHSYDGQPFSDIWIFLTWFMLILSFPAGLVVSLVHFTLGVALSITIETSNLSLILEWGAYFLLGYFQWFKLVPWSWRKWNARRVPV